MMKRFMARPQQDYWATTYRWFAGVVLLGLHLRGRGLGLLRLIEALPSLATIWLVGTAHAPFVIEGMEAASRR